MHGVLLLSLLRGGQSVHRTAQVRANTAFTSRNEVQMGALVYRVSSPGVCPGFMRSTACWRRSTTQHNRHGRTPNTSVSGTDAIKYFLLMVFVV